jgi:membrane protease YdiL (CAAX protease family)
MHTQKPPPKIFYFFISRDETRLRAVWRLILHALMILFLTLITGFIAAIALIIMGLDFTDPLGGLPKYVELFITLPPILVGTFIARTVLDHRSIVSLGLSLDRRMVRDLFIGFGISALMMGLIVLIEYVGGWLEVDSVAWNMTSNSDWGLEILGGFFYFIVIGFQEELIFRGYQLQNLVESLDLHKGLLISSLFFSLAHILNPFASLQSILGIFFSGLLLGYGWLRTQQLWLPIGLHIGWNFFEGVLFGFPVSGTDTFRLINHTVTGSTALTGGDFGPEAGLILIPALVLGALLIWLFTRRDSRMIVEPSLADELFDPHIQKK